MNTEAILALLRDTTLLFTLGVIGAAMLRAPLLRGLGAGAAYMSWLLVPLMLLSPALPDIAPRAVTEALPAAMPAAVERLATGPGTAAASALAAADRAGATPLPIAALALGLWALGAIALTAAMARRQRRYARGLERDGAQWRAPAGASPALVGLLPQRLVLPLDFEQRFDADERRLILAHEAVHARRYDNAWNLFGAALLALQWFNPLAWWAWRRMRADQELACDAAVLTTAERGLPLARYAEALLKSHRGAAAPVLATGWSARHPLVERVRMLGRHRGSALRRRAAPVVVLSLCAGAALLAQAAQDGAPAPRPATATASVEHLDKALGLVFELAQQQDAQPWQRSTVPFVLPDFHALETYRQATLEMPQTGWCLDVSIQRFPDGELRAKAGVRDQQCVRQLVEPQPLRDDGTVLDLAARTGTGALQVQLGMRPIAPGDPRLPAMYQALHDTMSPAQRKFMDERRRQTASARREQEALDEAWRAARAAAR